MAEFESAVERTLDWEGGYSVDPHDPGGETLFGIARKRHPEWTGWQRVDELKKHFSGSGLTGVLNADGGLKESAKLFYEENFWDYDDISSQAIANKVFDLGVNCGKHEAVKFLQRAVGTPDDGVFGPHTLEATNACNCAVLLDKIREVATVYYESLADFDRYGKGWLKRLDS